MGSNTLTFDGAGNYTVNDGITGTGGITKTGSGTLTLMASSSYSGATTLNNGTLKAGAAAGGQAFGNLSAVTLTTTPTNPTVLDLNGFDQTIGSLAGGVVGPPTNAGVALGGGTLTTGGNNSSTSFTGVISGTGSLTKEGSGTLTLGGSAANTYAGGATTVNQGVLLLSKPDNTSAIAGGRRRRE